VNHRKERIAQTALLIVVFAQAATTFVVMPGVKHPKTLAIALVIAEYAARTDFAVDSKTRKTAPMIVWPPSEESLLMLTLDFPSEATMGPGPMLFAKKTDSVNSPSHLEFNNLDSFPTTFPFLE